MNYKNIFTILLVLLIISTLCVLISKPKMHKVMLIYDSNYTLVNDNDTEENENVITTVKQETETKPLKTPVEINTIKKETVAPVKTIEKQNKKEVVPTKKVQTNTQKQPITVQKQIVTKKTAEQSKKAVGSTKPISSIQVVKQPIQKQEKQVLNPKTEQTVLTAEQEEILWNKWRSDLQNKIMSDVRLPIIPNGIVFRFSFDVDKYGKISNIQTWSTTPQYTPYAVQYIAPLIRSYQGRAILNFPKGSNRVTTKVTGGWRIASATKYSTPQDYNDTEKVIK